VTHHWISGFALAFHQGQGFGHVETGQVKLAHQGVEQGAICQWSRIGAMGSHNLIAAAEG